MKDLAKRVNVGIRRADAEDAESLSQLTSELLLSWLDMFAVPEIFSYLAEDDEPFGVVSVAPASDYWLDNAGDCPPEHWHQPRGNRWRLDHHLWGRPIFRYVSYFL